LQGSQPWNRPQNSEISASNDELCGCTFGSFSEPKNLVKCKKKLRIRLQNSDISASNDELQGRNFGSFSEKKTRKIKKNLRISLQNSDVSASNDELHGSNFGSFSEQKPSTNKKNLRIRPHFFCPKKVSVLYDVWCGCLSARALGTFCLSLLACWSHVME
jgi:hypothetical protein